MLRFFIGFIAALVGLWLVLFTFAVASMVDPRLQGREWWSEVLTKYCDFDDVKEMTILGLILMAGGTSLCISIWRRASHTRSSNEAMERTCCAGR